MIILIALLSEIISFYIILSIDLDLIYSSSTSLISYFATISTYESISLILIFGNLIHFVSVIRIDILSIYQDNLLSYSDSFSQSMIIQISTLIFLNISMINYLLNYQFLIISSLIIQHYLTPFSHIMIINI
jgi:hypothetical protein